MDAPSYTVFSNTTSMAAHNASHPPGKSIMSLESPHISIHLAIGGFRVPNLADDSPYRRCKRRHGRESGVFAAFAPPAAPSFTVEIR